MQNTTTTVIALVVAVILILVAPMLTLTERNDNVVQENVKQIIEKFVADIRNTGVITTSKYQTLESTLATTGNTYNIEIELQILDENPGKKTEQANHTKIGENVYYTEFTSQVLEKLDKQDGKLELKEGDYITVSVKNENNTAAQMIKSGVLSVLSAGQYEIEASSSGMIKANASNKELATTKTYIIKYDANGGIGTPNSQIKEHGKSITLSTVEPENKDHTFLGWNTKLDGTGQIYGAGSKYEGNEDVTFYAMWQKKTTFNIAYDTNGGTGKVPQTQTKEKGKSVTILDGAHLTKNQQEFAGWSLTKDGSVDYLPGEPYTRDESATLYAVWSDLSIYICSVQPSENQETYRQLPELIGKKIRSYYKTAKIDYSYGEDSLEYLKNNGKNYDLVIINEVANGNSIDASIINNLAQETNVITIGNRFDNKLLIIEQSQTLTAKLDNTEKIINIEPYATTAGKNKIGLEINNVVDTNVGKIKFISQVETLYGVVYSSEGYLYQDGINQNTKNLNTQHALGAWQNGNNLWIHSQIPLGKDNVNNDLEVILKLSRYILENDDADIVDPVWEKVGESADPLNANGSIATVVVQGTDNNLKSYRLEKNDIVVYVDGIQITNGITVELSEVRNLTDGIEYTITIKGYDIDAKQVKIEISEGTLIDSNTNTSKTTPIIVYNTLKSALNDGDFSIGLNPSNITFENVNYPFLGNTTIQRRNIENLIFVSSLADAPAINGRTCWDVSAIQDGSILAWYEIIEDKRLAVYIGSDDKIYGNQDSTGLFACVGYSAKETTEVINNIELLNTNNVTNMSYMFLRLGYNEMTTLDLGDNFDTSNVTNMSYMFRGCGVESMTNMELGDKFDTSKVRYMNNMFQWCGYENLTDLDLGKYSFDTSNVTKMQYMFYNCGVTSMTNLKLGNNFDTSKVTDMSSMFKNCGQTAMTSLDMGPMFKKISDNNQGFVDGCGKNNTNVIYCSNAIYLDIHNFKLQQTSNVYKNYARGTINPKYGPTWSAASTEIDEKNKQVIITLQGKAEDNTYAGNTLTIDKIDVYIDGELSTVLTKQLRAQTHIQGGVQYELVLSNFEQQEKLEDREFKEWSGNISLKIAADTLTDIYQNSNQENIIQEEETVDRNTEGKLFTDFIRPEVITTSIQNDTKSNVQIITFEVLDKYIDEDAYIDISKIQIYKSNYLQETIIKELTEEPLLETINGEQIQYGIKYILKLSNFITDIEDGENEISGYITVKLREGAIGDKSGNTNSETVLFDGFLDLFEPKITYKYWGQDLNKEEGTVSIVFEITDEYYKEGTLELSDLIIKIDGEIAENINVDFSKTDLTDEHTLTKIGEKYVLTLSGLTESGVITISIPAGLVSDTSGNTNYAKTISVQVDTSGAVGLQIGDFINYDAGTWTQDEIDAIQVGPKDSLVTPNDDTNLPTEAFQFGGFVAGDSRNENATPYYSSTYNYVKDASTGSSITGWRVFDIEDDGTVTLISAGNPEDYYHPSSSYAYASEYILTGQVNSSWSSSSASSYQKRDWDVYVNANQKATNATVLTKSRLDSWFSKYIVANANTYTNETFRKIYEEPYLSYQNMVENYSFYWLSEAYNSRSVHYVSPNVRRCGYLQRLCIRCPCPSNTITRSII